MTDRPTGPAPADRPPDHGLPSADCPAGPRARWWIPVVAALAALVLHLAGPTAGEISRLRSAVLTGAEALAVAVLVGWLVVWLKDEFVAARAPVLIAIAYVLLLQTDQGVDTIRAINQSSPWSQIGSYLLWFAFSMYLAGALYATAILELPASSPARTRAQNLLLTFLLVAPFVGTVTAGWQATDVALAWPPDPAVAGRLLDFALRVLLFGGMAVGALYLGFGAVFRGRSFRGNELLKGIDQDPANRLASLGLIFALLPIVIFVASLWNTSWDVAPVVFLAGWCGLLAAALRCIEWLALRGAEGEAAEKQRAALTIMLLAGILVLLIIGARLAAADFQSVAPLAIPAIWFGALGLALVLVSWRGPRRDMPAVTLFMLLGVLLSLLDLNDNHELPFARTNAETRTAEEGFRTWLQQPRGGAKHQTAFVVVAEGGGARAAYMTALVLEALRSRCQDFARSHFATIGVSGGSVGAALSAAAPPPASYDADCTKLDRFDPQASLPVAVAGTDLLRPVLRGLLAADLPMRFFPGSLWQTAGEGRLDELQRPWVGRLGDRAQYIEWRLDLAWREGRGGAGLRDRMFAGAWPGPGGDGPALILLGTDVGSGRRIAISHLGFGEAETTLAAPKCLSPGEPTAVSAERRSRLLTMAEVAPGRDPTLLGAAVTSARFPLITPAATLPCPGPRWRLVDGGYFENSGLTTALELVEEMAQGASTASRNVRVVLIRIENGGADATGRGEPPAWLGELFSPLRAFLGTRDARADQARRAADRAEAAGRHGRGCFDGHGLACVFLVQERLHLRKCEVAVPLGWSLSDGAQREIRQQLGFGTEAAASTCVKDAAEHNRAVLTRIMRRASGAE